MKKTRYALIFAVLLILSTTYSCSKEKNNSSFDVAEMESVNSDAFNEELIIPIGEDSISGYALIASGNNLKETVILIQGYPGNDTNFDIGQDIRENGKNVILFHHRGAWGSQGVYSYSNCLNDIKEIVRFLTQDEMSSKLRIKTDDFTLMGRSFGGGIALIEGSRIKSVKRIIAISTVNYGVIMKKYNSIDELGSFKRYMQDQIMINHDIDDFLQELLDKREEYNIADYSDELKAKKVLLIEESDKNEDWISQMENIEYLIIDSDHDFVNERSKLQSTILNWLENR